MKEFAIVVPGGASGSARRHLTALLMLRPTRARLLVNAVGSICALFIGLRLFRMAG